MLPFVERPRVPIRSELACPAFHLKRQREWRYSGARCLRACPAPTIDRRRNVECETGSLPALNIETLSKSGAIWHRVDGGNRTLDRWIKSPVLYPLSYIMEGMAGLEPAVSGLRIRRSHLLSHMPLWLPASSIHARRITSVKRASRAYGTRTMAKHAVR